MNPCKCGNGGPGASCKRGPRCAADYLARISGPLLNRIDLQIEVPARILEEIATPDAEGVALLRQAADALHLSARGFHRTLRIASTLADLDGIEKVGPTHIAEALSYRGETLRRAHAA